MRKWPTSVAVAIPLLVCSVATCQEAIPDNVAPPANLFGIKRGNQTEVFVASDVSKKVEKAVTQSKVLTQCPSLAAALGDLASEQSYQKVLISHLRFRLP